MIRMPRPALVASLVLTAGLLGACGQETMKSIEKEFKEIDPALSEMETFEGSYLAHLQQEGLPKLDKALPIDQAARQRVAKGSGAAPVDRPQVANESIIHAPAVTRYLQNLTEEVLAQWPGEKPRDLKVYLTDGDAPKAAAYGTHEIFVTWSLLANPDLTESALRVFIGHELSHILLNHFTESVVSEAQKQAVAQVLDVTTTSTVMTGAAGAAGALEAASASSSEGPKDTLTDEQRAKALKLANASDKWAEWLVGSAWGRRQEEQADLLGIELALRSGGDLQGVFVFAKIVTEAAMKKQYALDAYDKEAQAFVESADGNVGTLALGAPRFLFLGTVAGISDMFDRFTSDYVEPEKRERILTEYTRRQFGGAQPVVGLTSLLAGAITQSAGGDRLIALRQTGEFRTVADAYTLVARVEDAAGDREQLRTLAPRMMQYRSGPVAQDPAVRLALYRVRLAQGQGGSAVQNLTLASRDGGAPKVLYESLAAEYIRRGDYDRAQTVIGDGTREIGATWPFYLSLIDLYKARKQPEQAQRIVGLCRNVASERAAGLDDADEVVSLGDSCERRFLGTAS